MKLILSLIFSFLLAQGPLIPFPGSGSPLAARANTFAYVASSVTACETNTSTGTCTYALHASPTAGNLLICGAFWHDTGAQNASMSSTRNGSLIPIGSKSSGGGFSDQMFYVPAVLSSGADTVTLTINSASTIMGWECAAYSYSGATTTFDGTPIYSQTTAVGTTATIGTITTTNANGLITAHCLGISAGVCAVGTGYTGRNDLATCSYNGSICTFTNRNFNSDVGNLLEELTGAATGSKSATFTTTSGAAAALGMVAF